jgi:prepilin peptidase CpaA
MEDYLLWIVLIIALITDIRSRRILNVVTLPAILAGLIYHSIINGWSGLMMSGGGFLVGLGLLLIPFAMGGMGAGDVKLLAAVGSLKGAAFVFQAFLYTAIIGGIIAILLLAWHKELGEYIRRLAYSTIIKDFKSFSPTERIGMSRAVFPYGVAIVLGSLSAYIWSGF